MKQQIRGNWTVGFEQLLSGDVEWRLFRWKKVVREGTADSLKAARRALQTAWGEVALSEVDKSTERAPLRLALRYWYKKRFWLLKAVLLLKAEGTSRKEICRVADEDEKHWHWQDRTMLGWKPWKLHALSKKPAELAGILYDALEGLGWSSKKIMAWGVEYYGPSFGADDFTNWYEVDKDGNKVVEPYQRPDDDWVPGKKEAE
jgi:hypothetical protein